MTPATPATMTVATAPSVAAVKRFLERWAADERFRAEVEADPQGAPLRRGIPVDARELRPLFDPDAEGAPASPLVEAYRAFRQERLEHCERVRRESAPAEPRFRAWRARQMARVRTELRPLIHDSIVHPVFAVELSKGCSVGCWFCGVGALRLEDQFLHTPDNARLWRQTLDVLAGFTGPVAARWGFLYWATDPFDNPDYEKFCFDFRDAFGLFPHTTTAQPLRDSERSRAFIRLAEANGCHATRFSILSLGVLDRLHALMSAGELTHVELVLQMKTSVLKKSSAGRSRERARQQAAREGRDFEDSAGDTIACVSGFLLNMVERTVRLVSPCAASDRWPLGYFVHDEGRFEDAGELEALVEAMIERHMPETIRPRDRVRFRRDLAYEPLDGGFRVSARWGRLTFDGNPFLEELGRIIAAGDRTAEEIAGHFGDRYGVEPDSVAGWLSLVFDNGVLDEEPAPREGERRA